MIGEAAPFEEEEKKVEDEPFEEEKIVEAEPVEEESKQATTNHVPRRRSKREKIKKHCYI